jgi:hypothetical protein
LCTENIFLEKNLETQGHRERERKREREKERKREREREMSVLTFLLYR